MSADSAMEAPAFPKSRSLIITLAGIAMMSGVLVVLAYQLTLPRIILNKQQALEEAIFTVLPEATAKRNYLLDESGLQPLPEEDFARANLFAGYDAEGRLTGLAMEGAARGYQDVVRVLYAYSVEDACITGMTVLESKETPGLGDRVETDPDFLANFDCLQARLNEAGTALAQSIETVKHGKKTDPWQIDGISGATVTSTAIGNAIQGSASEMLPQLVRHLDSLDQSIPVPPASQ